MVAMPDPLVTAVVSRRATMVPEEFAKKMEPLPLEPAVDPAAWRVKFPVEESVPAMETTPVPEGVMFTFSFVPPEVSVSAPEFAMPFVVM